MSYKKKGALSTDGAPSFYILWIFVSFLSYGFCKFLHLYDPEMEALLLQGTLDLLDVGCVAGLHGDTKHAGIHLVAVG